MGTQDTLQLSACQRPEANLVLSVLTRFLLFMTVTPARGSKTVAKIISIEKETILLESMVIFAILFWRLGVTRDTRGVTYLLP